MEEKLCEAKHERVNEKLDIHERRINNHSERLDKIELSSGRLEERLNSLIQQLEHLNRTMKWFIGLMIASFIGFFFYVVQQGIVR